MGCVCFQPINDKIRNGEVETWCAGSEPRKDVVDFEVAGGDQKAGLFVAETTGAAVIDFAVSHGAAGDACNRTHPV